MIEKILEHLQKRDFEQAESGLRELLTQDPGNAEGMFLLSQVRQQLGDLDEALELMQGASQSDPFNPNLHHAIGALHFSRREAEEAQQSFLRALEIDPAHVAAHNGIALVELTRGRFEAAEHAANLALAEDPENVQALIYMGSAKLERGELQPAIGYLQEALRVQPENHNAQRQLGRAFLAADNAAFAIQCFENALQATPGSAELHDFLACAQLRAGQIDKAAANFRKAMTLGRSNVEVFNGLAKCELLLGNEGQSEVLMRRAVEIAPDNVDAVANLAEFRLLKGNAAEAMKLLSGLPRGAVERVHVLASRAQRGLGEPAEALAELEAWVDKGKASIAATLEFIDLLNANGREEQATELLDGILKTEKPPLSARIFKAVQLATRGDDEGVEMLRELAALKELQPMMRLGLQRTLAGALQHHGRYAEAADAYRAMAVATPDVLRVIDEAPAGNRAFLESTDAAEVAAQWPKQPPRDDRPRPVFVFSWPGSGRERVISALEAHPDVMLIADQMDTQKHRRSLISKPFGARDLAVLPQASQQLARGRYWKDLAKGGLEPGERQAVDAMWIAAENLPTIARLFPEAAVLVIGREPGDMVLSWLQGGLANIEGLAAKYRQQTDLMTRCRDALGLEFIDVDYDALCADPGAGLDSIVTRLGLKTNGAVQERFLKTAPAVDNAPGDWKLFAEQLEGALSTLRD